MVKGDNVRGFWDLGFFAAVTLSVLPFYFFADCLQWLTLLYINYELLVCLITYLAFKLTTNLFDNLSGFHIHATNVFVFDAFCSIYTYRNLYVLCFLLGLNDHLRKLSYRLMVLTGFE